MTITFRAAGTTIGSGFLDVPRPTGTIDGDLLILTSTEANGGFFTPGGWTLVDFVGPSSGPYTQTWWRIASSEPSTTQLTKPSAGAGAAVQLAYAGHDRAIRAHATATLNSGTTNLSPTPGLLSGMKTGDFGIICYGEHDGFPDSRTMSVPSGWNLRSGGTLNNYDGATHISFLVVDKLDGFSRPTTGQIGGGGASASWAVNSIAIAAPQDFPNFLPFF